MKDGLDAKRNAKQIQRYHEKALIQSFEKSAHQLALAHYLHSPFVSGHKDRGSRPDPSCVGSFLRTEWARSHGTLGSAFKNIVD